MIAIFKTTSCLFFRNLVVRTGRVERPRRPSRHVQSEWLVRAHAAPDRRQLGALIDLDERDALVALDRLEPRGSEYPGLEHHLHLEVIEDERLAGDAADHQVGAA